MTFEEFDQLLPNGLHDAQLTALRIDYANRKAVLEVDVDVSTVDQTPPESFRPAQVVFSQLQFVVVDAPGPSCDGVAASAIDAGPGYPSTSPAQLPPLADGAFLCWIFLARSNSFIRIAAEDVELLWLAA